MSSVALTAPSTVAAYDFSPATAVLLVGVVLALLPIALVMRRRQSGALSADAVSRARLRALTFATLFLCVDLVLLGAFTRLSDSGLGCPDWPGCYGNASPIGAHGAITAAQIAMPTGPVTHAKAWIEMAHRYLATALGVVIALLAVLAWLPKTRRVLPASPWWATATLMWIVLQGVFGAWTVTLRLYPLVVTAHLLGGMVLLALLTAQSRFYEPKPMALAGPLRVGIAIVFVLVAMQVALGGWVSTNYAVLACTDFPTCQGSWWPAMSFGDAFALPRELGRTAAGGYLAFADLTAIHMVHRIGACALLIAMLLLAWRLVASGSTEAKRWALGLVVLVLAQSSIGIVNVVFGWPLLAAMAHTAGAGALVMTMTALCVQVWSAHPRTTLLVARRAGGPSVVAS